MLGKLVQVNFFHQLLDYIIKFKQPILLSTGLANFSEIDKKVKKII